LLPQRLRAPFADSCLAVSPDGKSLALGASGDRFPATFVAVVPLGGDGPVRQLEGHRAPISAVAYSPDGARLASGDETGDVILWDTAAGRPGGTLPGRVVGIAFSPEGRRVAAAAADGIVKVWQANDGTELLVISGRGVEATSVVFLSEQRLAVGMKSGEVSVWDVEARQEQFVLRGHSAPEPRVHALAATRDGQRLASTGQDGTLLIWDATCGTEHRRIKLWDNFTGSYALQDGGSRALASLNSGVVEFWDVTGPRLLWRRIAPSISLMLAISADGSRVALAGEDRSVYVLDAQGNERRVLRDHRGRSQALAFSADGRRLVSGAGFGQGDGEVWLWDLDTDGPGGPLPGVGPQVLAVAFSPDGRQVAAVDGAAVVHAWDVTTRQELWQGRARSRSFRCLGYSPDGNLLAAGTEGQVELFDARDGRLVRTLDYDGVQPNSVAFSPDGRRLAAGGIRVRLWDVATGQPALTLAGPGLATFSPDGRRLVGCGPEGQAWEWDATPLPPDAR
jgi:WD40 repeat protein